GRRLVRIAGAYTEEKFVAAIHRDQAGVDVRIDGPVLPSLPFGEEVTVQRRRSHVGGIHAPAKITLLEACFAAERNANGASYGASAPVGSDQILGLPRFPPRLVLPL